MSEKQVIFRNGKAHLYSSDRVSCLHVKDVVKHMPIHIDKDYNKKELKELLEKLIEERKCLDSVKWVYKLLINALRDFRRGDMGLDEFLEDDIGYNNLEKTTELDSLTTVMNTDVVIEDGTTFGHIWNYIEKDYEVFSVIFLDSLGGFDLQKWIDHAHIPHEKGTWERECEREGTGMEGICCYWNAVIEQNDYSRLKGEFGGWGKHNVPIYEGDKMIREEIQECSYGVSFTPINAMLPFPFRLDEEIEITNLEFWDGKNYEFPDVTPAIKTKRRWCCYEMIEAILWELSFMGTPQQQDEKHDEIKERIEGIKDGTVKTLPFKDLIDDINEDKEENNE